MKSNLLLEKIKQLQVEYRNLLKSLLPSLKTAASPAALDEINLFWFKNMDLVRLYLVSQFSDKDSYVFTASTYLDYEDKEHYPFLLLGKNHILDDPLCRYSKDCNRMQGKYLESLLKQISITAEDDIKIIDECNEHILILPVRLLNQNFESVDLYKIGEQAFISLFKNFENLKDYYRSCKSFSDILENTRDDIGNIVLFSETDDKSLPFQQRFNQAKEKHSFMFEDNQTEVNCFFIMVYSFIEQALDVIASCIEYKCIPFIRYPVAINYIFLIAESINDSPFIAEMKYKMCIANLIHRICDKEKLSAFGFEKFISEITSQNFGEKIFHSLLEIGINEDKFDYQKSVLEIERCLNELYKSLNKTV